MIAVGGGPSIQVYDLISGKSLITLDNFQKTVTSVKLTKDGGFLMGGSLDRYVKCYDTSDWSLCNSVKFPGMVSAIDISVSLALS
jgi:U3 small nucleolar RNA-associated protein 15